MGQPFGQMEGVPLDLLFFLAGIVTTLADNNRIVVETKASTLFRAKLIDAQ